MEQKAQEERLKMAKELIRKTREERTKMEQRTQEQRTRMMQKVAAHISEKREKMVQRITRKVMRILAARNSVAVTSDTDLYSFDSFAGYEKSMEERKKMEQRVRVQKLIREKLATRQSVTLRFGTDFDTSNRFEGYKKSMWVNDDNARSAASVFFYGIPRPGKDDDVSYEQPCKIIGTEDDYSCWTLNQLVYPEKLDHFSGKALGAESMMYCDVMKQEALMKGIEDQLVKEILFVEEGMEDKVAAQDKEAKKSKKRSRWDK